MMDLMTLQVWLEKATGYDMPASVDSAAIAGLVDLIRTAGCFALSARFACLLAVDEAPSDHGDHVDGGDGDNANGDERNHEKSVPFHSSSSLAFPSWSDYSKLGKVFEAWLPHFCRTNQATLYKMKTNLLLRRSFIDYMVSKIQSGDTGFELAGSAFAMYAAVNGGADTDVEQAHLNTPPSSPLTNRAALSSLVTKTVNAFFDNDIFFTTKFFMKHAVGSFGLMVTSSMDAKRCICIAARAQPMSIAFFPRKGLICYGSELAAVKAGMLYDCPGKDHIPKESTHASAHVFNDITSETCRYDLDDLGGEILMLDYSGKEAKVTTHQESFVSTENRRARIVPLRKNEFLIPLSTEDCKDPILNDIQSIPNTLKEIQVNWKEGGLNRMAAWNLGRRLKERLRDKVKNKDDGSSVDILVTGCEVSLYVAEQFASDMQKAFPKLNIQATSNNKILGVLGQELSVPTVGFPISERVSNLKKTIVIIVSHSGGTFGPLAISNLLQSMTKSIFVVSSDWDTQIGKQIRSMFLTDNDIFGSRVFSTGVGIRESEPCSLTLCAAHQLLTQIFQYLSLVILMSANLGKSRALSLQNKIYAYSNGATSKTSKRSKVSQAWIWRGKQWSAPFTMT